MEDAIQNLKRRYEQSKRKVVPKHDLKRIKNAKGKWTLKRGRPQDESGKDNAFPYKGFNTVEKGHGEQQASGSGREPLQCWICGKDHCRGISHYIRVVVDPRSIVITRHIQLVMLFITFL